MVQGQALIEILTERIESIQIDNYYTQGIKYGLKEAIELIQIAETVNPLKDREVAHV